MKEIIINNVLEHRSRKGITQEDLAQALNVSRQTVISIEKGNYTPSVSLALLIAHYFKTTVEEIFKITYEK